MYLSVDQLPIPGTSGALGLSRCPGTGELWPGAMRRLDEDLEVIRDWGGTAVVTLNQYSELVWLGLSELGSRVGSQGLVWWHCPIVDFGAPGPDFEQAWASAGPEIQARLSGGERVLLHCLAGLGRTGTIAARILMERGVSAEDAVLAVRRARPGSIQSEEQMRYLMDRTWERL